MSATDVWTVDGMSISREEIEDAERTRELERELAVLLEMDREKGAVEGVDEHIAAMKHLRARGVELNEANYLRALAAGSSEELVPRYRRDADQRVHDLASRILMEIRAEPPISQEVYDEAVPQARRQLNQPSKPVEVAERSA